ncbi:hypothetical protein G6D98_001031 [Salmonella bongori]|nr:hypothetical protein [Salmonella bongori]
MPVQDKLPIICVPRASGDKPLYGTANPPSVSVFPAPAGINRRQAEILRDIVRVPRASGDKPTTMAINRKITACSPRQRG